MTIAIGLRHDKKIYVGADSLWSYDDSFVKHGIGSKFLALPDGQLAVAAGQVRFSQLFTRFIRDNKNLASFSCLEDVQEIADKFLTRVLDAGIGEAGPNELPDHDFEILLVTSACPSLFVISGDYSVEELKKYACIGSGGSYAEAALEALSKVNITGRKALETALDTACQLHPFCGGKPEIKSIDLD